MQKLAGFCGPTYVYNNKFAAVERCINWYPNVNESNDESKFEMCLDESPGNLAFGTLPVPTTLRGPCQALLTYQDVLYGINAAPTNSYLWKMDSAGNYTALGPLSAWNTSTYQGPVTMVGNGNGQIFMCSSFTTTAYVYNTAGAGTLTSLPPASGFLGANTATFQDGYILVLTTGSRQFQISGTNAVPIGDATQWDASNISVQAGQADFLANIISSREYVRILGERRSQVYYNAGASGLGGFPFQSYNSTFIETGLGAVYSLKDMGDSLIWIGQDDRGIRACWRDFGFQPQRISTESVEQIWQSYATIADGVAFPFIWKGHLFYQITFPSARATWVYDATVSQLVGRPIWHERTFLSPSGVTIERPERFHAFCYGKHLVGSAGADGNPGAVYQYADSYTDQAFNGTTNAQVLQPIVPTRIVPHVFSSRNRIIINRIRVDMQLGVGLAGSGAGSNPQLNLQISRDGGNTYGAIYQAPVGKNGVFTQMVNYNRLGYGRDIVFKFYGDGSAVPFNLVGAYIDAFECAS